MAYRKVTLLGTPHVKEYTCNGAITPGHLCELNSSGQAIVHNSADAPAAKMFALEDDLQGAEIGTAYTTLNKGQFGLFRSGDEVAVLNANGENIAIGDLLVSNGDGTLKEYVLGAAPSAVEQPSSIVAVALEAIDLSGSSSDPAAPWRIRAEVY